MSYCLDTSSLMEAWERSYSLDVFPSFWEKLEGLIEEETVISPDEVLVELSKKDDGLHKWAKKNEKMFQPLEEEIQDIAKEILGKFPKLVDERLGKGSADPFVIALARHTGRIVVTEEGGGTHKRPKIPNVCEYFGVKHITLLSMIKKLNWSF